MLRAHKTGGSSSTASSSATTTAQTPSLQLSEEQSIIPPRVFRRKTGIYQKIRPRNDDTLYYALFNARSTYEIQDIVIELVNDASNSQSNGLLTKLVRLVLDVSDYQHYEVLGGVNREQLAEFVQKIASVAPQGFQGSRHIYVAKSGNEATATITLTVCNFLDALLKNLASTNDLCHSEDFLTFSMFLKTLSIDCQVVCVRHTATVLACKMLTTLLSICEDEQLRESSTFEEQETLRNYVKLYFTAFTSNCALPGKEFDTMRGQCIKECSVWMQMQPSLYFDACLKEILGAVSDKNLIVREVSSEMLKELLLEDELKPYFKLHLNKLVKCFSKRVEYNTNNDRTLVMEMCEILMDKYDQQFTNAMLARFREAIYETKADHATAACRIFVKNVQKTSRNNFTSILNAILNFAKKDLDRLPLFVEAIKPVYPPLLEFDTSCKILERRKIPEDNEEIFVLFMLQLALQCVTGESPLKRTNRRVEIPVFETSVQTCKTVLEMLANVPEKWIDNARCLKALKQFLSVFAPESDLVKEINFKDISAILADAFLNETSPDLSLVIDILALNLSEEHVDVVSRHAEEAFNQINALHISEEVTPEYTKQYQQLLLVIEKIDIHTRLNWDALFSKIKLISQTTPNNLIKSILLSCSWYLTWKLRCVCHEQPEETNQAFVTQSWSDFVSTCVELLDNLPDKEAQLFVCESVYMFRKNLGELRQNAEETGNNSVSNLEDICLNHSQEQILSNCVHAILFDKNSSVNLNLRIRLLAVYMNVVTGEQIYASNVINVFRHFNEFMPEYEDYFLYYWKLFGADQPVVACKTLALVYEEIEAESENLLMLVAQFKSRLSDNSCYNFLQHSVNYVYRTKHFAFLKFVASVVRKMSSSNKRKLLTLIEETFSVDAADENVQHILGILKN